LTPPASAAGGDDQLPLRFLGAKANATLSVLDANPLNDIHNTKKINAVVIRGRLLERKDLDAMLVKSEAVANEHERLFAYDAWANREEVQRLRSLDSPPAKAIKILAHIIGTEWLFLGRLRRNPKPAIVWPDLPLDDCAAQIEKAGGRMAERVWTNRRRRIRQLKRGEVEQQRRDS